MTWIKLDDKSPRHPKIASLTDRAFRWWINGLCYASEFLTNGKLPPVFWKQTPKQVRSELSDGNLWDWRDPNFEIHDYLGHQSSKESVEKKKADSADRVARYRERKRNAVTSNAESVTGNAEVTVPDTENREQIQRTERTPTTNGVPKQHQRGTGLLVGGGEYVRLLESHAYVGAKLRVPKVLHSELMAKSGANADEELRKWYASLDERLEAAGKGTGDVFEWLRPRHQAYAKHMGWIEEAPKNGIAAPDRTAQMDRLEKIYRGEIKR